MENKVIFKGDIESSDYQLGEILGKGAYSTVYKVAKTDKLERKFLRNLKIQLRQGADLKRGEKTYAMKVIRKDQLND